MRGGLFAIHKNTLKYQWLASNFRVRLGRACIARQTYLYSQRWRCSRVERLALAPFVYRLGRQIFNLKRRVRLP